MGQRRSHVLGRERFELTPRQREVLDLIARGKTNYAIAEELGITLDGAKHHVREILAKLEVDSREDAADWWRQQQRAPRRMQRWTRSVIALGMVKLAGPVAAGVVVVAAGLSLWGTESDAPESDAPRPPAASYTLLVEDLGNGSWTAARTMETSRKASERPDFYPEEALNVWFIMAPAAAHQELLDRLRPWGWIDSYSVTLAGDAGRMVTSKAHVFETSAGAAEAFAFLKAQQAKHGTELDSAPGLPGDESALVRLPFERKPSEEGLSLIFRRNDVVAELTISGVDPSVSEILALARTVDAKISGGRASPSPTPMGHPTPAAPPPWVPQAGGTTFERISESVGPSHCDWQSVRLLAIDWGIYFKDIDGIFPVSEATESRPAQERFEFVTTLPASAIDTGYRSGARELWLSGNPADVAVYVVDGDVIERWPRLVYYCF